MKDFTVSILFNHGRLRTEKEPSLSSKGRYRRTSTKDLVDSPGFPIRMDEKKSVFLPSDFLPPLLPHINTTDDNNQYVCKKETFRERLGGKTHTCM